jgi:hypothetical protein
MGKPTLAGRRTRPKPRDRKVRNLTTKEREFVLNLVAGGSQIDAYRKAGYSHRGAAAGASRLAKQLHIIDAIAGMKREAERLRTEAHARQRSRVNEMLTGAQKAAANSRRGVDPADLELRASIDAEVAAIISYDYADAALVENLEIAMGRKPARESIVTCQKGKKDAEGNPVPPIVLEFEIYKRDGAAVNRALEMLFERASVRGERRAGAEQGQPLSEAARAAFLSLPQGRGFPRRVTACPPLSPSVPGDTPGQAGTTPTRSRETRPPHTWRTRPRGSTLAAHRLYAWKAQPDHE